MPFHQRIKTITLTSAVGISPGFAQENIYLSSGFPAPSRKWTGMDYEVVARLLSSGKVPFPRYSDPLGAPFIARITSTENLEFMKNKVIPLDDRFADLGRMLPSTSSILMAYYRSSTTSRQSRGKELARLMAFMLHVAATGIDLTDEKIPTIPNDANYSYRMDGVNRVKSGATTIFVGAETSLSERTHFSDDDRSVLLLAMEKTLPTFIRVFKLDYRAELKNKLTKRKSEFNRKEDLKNLDSMIQALAS